MMARAIHVAPADEVFDNYLRRCSLAHALFRTSEALQLFGTTLARPVLDVGCGTGEFASCALTARVDVGVDISSNAIRRAHKSNMYSSLNVASADCLPYSTGMFQTVISISVLEHITCPINVLREIRRVLRPGGEFLATITLADLNDRLLGRSILRRLGGNTDFGYSILMDRAFNHVTMRSANCWEQTILEAGFKSVDTTRIVPPKIAQWWEALLICAWPSKFTRFLTWHPKWMRKALWKVFRSVVVSSAVADGVCLFAKAS
jgi:ubiquinone/menaquinone biosynthesis C-methylase UbiE